MTPEHALLVAFALPLLGALGVRLTDRWPNARDAITLTASVATFIAVLSLLDPIRDGERPEVVLATIGPGLTLAFGLEPLGMLFALVASGLWIVTSLYAIGYMRGHHEIHQTRFFTYFAVAIAAALGIAFSRNLLTLFLFYEALTLSTYPLVTHHGTDEARRAGRIYLGILMSTSILLLLLAIVATHVLTGTNEMRLGGVFGAETDDRTLGILLVLYTYGVGKAALMPLHRWLPNAMVAPTPVSALLHAVAVVKAGVFTILKIVLYVFGLDAMARLGSALFLGYVAAATIVVSSIIALRQDDLKARLAYSTISQLAYIVLGAMMATSTSIIGASLHIATHAVGKITLFFCAGAIQVAAHKRRVSELDGLGRAMPLTMGAFAIASLSIIGLPPAAGFWSKWYLALGAAEIHEQVFLAALMLSSVLNIAYLLPIPIRAFFLPVRAPSEATTHDAAGPEPTTETGAEPTTAPSVEPSPGDAHAVEGGTHAPRTSPWHEAPWACVVPLCITAAACIALFFGGEWIVELVHPLILPPDCAPDVVAAAARGAR